LHVKRKKKSFVRRFFIRVKIFVEEIFEKNMPNAMKRAAKLTAANVKSIKKQKKSREVQKTDSETNGTEISSATAKPLLSLGKLYQGTVLRRPSKHNKSPYVADVKLDDGGDEIIAHAPMLDLGGLIKPGTVVRMKESKPGGKTSHSIQLVGVNEVECGSDAGITWIGANPNLGNSVAKELIQQGHITAALLGDSKINITKIQSEVKMKSHDGEDTVRSDFVINEKVVVEVKSCVCADYQKDTAPEFSKKDRYVIVVSEDSPDQYQRAGIFPIGKPAQKFEDQKVVSERCIKHLRHLSKIASGKDKKDYKESALLMMVNRGDCQKFRPCKESCPIFADEFMAAVVAGVRVVAAKIIWNENGDCYFGGLLPIITNE